MQKKFLPLTCLATAAFLCSCGDDITEISRVQRTEMYFSVDDELPGCGASEKDKIYYLDGFHVCNGKKWVELVGADGQKGETGKNGTYCITEEIKEGQKIICDGDSVGVLKNITATNEIDIETKGEKGAPGDTGKVGDTGEALVFDAVLTNGENGNDGGDGRDGIGTEIVKNEDGTYTQIAGNDTLKIYGAICGTTAYDPAGDKFCSGVSLVDKCGGKEYTPGTEACCNEAVFNQGTHFCGSDNKVYALCNGSSYDVTTQVCTSNVIYNKCGNSSYNPSTHFCDTRDNHVYKFVKIGNQTWMAENLAYWTSGYYCYGSSNATYTTAAKCKDSYGWAYSFVTAKKACPSGWKLPTRSEFNTLASAAGSAKALKSTSGWYNGGNGNNSSGFNGYPNGFRSNDQFYNKSYQAYFWTSEAKDGTYAYYFNLDYYNTQPSITYNGLESGMSVRCLKK